ncbi:HAMP domain-containing sensor histidine kinase [Microtetraspora sp. NBRC 16547]|uniref:sensor histidine kinase n=1 Tax=Microtetraspora sp. NBRC 16547 TaxID=3030993 RepID=UPI002554B9D5|nr:HAMP domain-containing sensor histidine kinase [Microtetraspora sp. NBRC 16547]
MALLCAVASVFILLAIHGNATDYRQQQLVSDAVRIVQQVRRKGIPTAIRDSDDFSAQLYNPVGTLVAATPDVKNAPPLGDFGTPDIDTYAIRHLCDMPSFPGECQIVLAFPIDLANGVWWLYAASPGVPWYVSSPLLGTIAGGSLLLVLLTMLGAYRTVNRTLEPVDAITDKLAKITTSDLSQRVPVPHFQDELRRLAETANQTLDRAEAAVEHQRRFASDASHDLRSPLTAMRAEVEEALLHPDETDWQETGKALLESLERLQYLVTDLLQIARLDAGAPGRHDPIDLAELVESELDRRPRDVAVTRRLTPSAVINGDRFRLARLLTNLLDNAERHADSNVTVIVERQGNTAVLEVVDDGGGIPPDQREIVFQRFARLDAARSRDAGGTGLGLSIARQIAETHGGSLTLEDSPRGARFVLRIPAAG